MAATIQIKRGIGAPVAILASGEPAFDTTNHILYVGDGAVNTPILSAALTSGRIFVGSAGNLAVGVVMSGDAAIINTGAITIQPLAITTGKINTNAVTYAKMQQASTVTLLGNPTGGLANIQEITLGAGLNFSGSTLVATGSGGTVTSVSVVTANGISGSVATATTTPAITLTLGAITPTSVNGITFSGSGSISNTGVTALTAFTGSGTTSGTNTGDQTIASLSPLTTKGDVFTFSTVNTRLGIGADAAIFMADAAATTGNKWIAVSGDITIALTGVTAIGALKVTNAMIAASTIDLTAKVTGVLPPANGGTGIANNAASTITISGNFATTITVSNTTSVTLPTSGTIFSDKANSITSAQLISAVTDETGTGALVFGTSPTLTTAILGSSTATTQLASDNTTKVATTAYVTTAIGAVNPLTTKGDLYSFSSVPARLAVGGTDGQILQVSSAATTGLTWSTATYPTTTSVNQLLYSTSANVVGGSANLIYDGSQFTVTRTLIAATQAIGLQVQNTTAAAAGAQQASPMIVQTGQGWATGVNNSQAVDFGWLVLPAQAATNPTGTLNLYSRINGGAWSTNWLSITSGGVASFATSLNSPIIGTTTQTIAGAASSVSQKYRLTNAGGDVAPQLSISNATVTAGTLAFAIDLTNGITLLHANGTRQIASGGIALSNLVNTAASESADMIFLTQAAGAAMTEKVSITSGGNLTIFNPAGTFRYTITPAAIAAARILNLPLITATDTLAALGLGQTFSGQQVFSSSSNRFSATSSNSVLAISSNAASVNGHKLTNGGALVSNTTLEVGNGTSTSGSCMHFEDANGICFCKSNGTSQIVRAGIWFSTTNDGAGTEDGSLLFNTQTGGAAQALRLTISSTAITATIPITLKGYTVAGLPAGVVGMVAYCTDLLTPTYLVAAVGGGAVVGPVFYTGSGWVSF